MPAARALLKTRVNDKLPEDVLLEIFDAYRQDHDIGVHRRHNKVWNSKNGWFILAHVCRSWRRAVLLSPSRLHLRLLFTPSRSAGAMVLRRLPPLPVLVDCDASYWTEKEDRLALSAIKHRDRVRGITLSRPYTYTTMLHKLLNTSFPNLESLDFWSFTSRQLDLPATFLSGSTSCLRQLTLDYLAPTSLSPVLSSTRALVELTLRMPFLRRLELRLSYHGEAIDIAPNFSPPTASAGNAVTLPKLTDFIFEGRVHYLNMLADGLAAPSLQRLDIRVQSDGPPLLPNRNLCRFIADTEYQLIAVCLVYLAGNLGVDGATRSSIESDRDPPLRIYLPITVSPEEIGDMLSRPLSTVEELEVRDLVITEGRQWRGLFKRLPQLKVITMSSNMVLDVARAFQPNREEPALEVLPALEQIKVAMILNKSDNESIRSAFEPLIAARQGVGRHIGLSWPSHR
ncbi:hypothetical protein V8E53_011707 [Lactarius tabidus]